MNTQFRLSNGSFINSIGENTILSQPIVNENIYLARLLNWASSSLDVPGFKVSASDCFSFLIQDEVRSTFYSEPSLLLLFEEVSTAPITVKIFQIDSNCDLQNIARGMLGFYANIHVLNQNEAHELPGAHFNKNTILLCTNSYCSPAITTKEELADFFFQ